MRKIFFLLALLLPFFPSRVDAEDKNVVNDTQATLRKYSIGDIELIIMPEMI